MAFRKPAAFSYRLPRPPGFRRCRAAELPPLERACPPPEGPALRKPFIPRRRADRETPETTCRGTVLSERIPSRRRCAPDIPERERRERKRDRPVHGGDPMRSRGFANPEDRDPSTLRGSRRDPTSSRDARRRRRNDGGLDDRRGCGAGTGGEAAAIDEEGARKVEKA